MSRHYLISFFSVIVTVLTAAAVAVAPATAESGLGRVLPVANSVPNSYIVVLRDGITSISEIPQTVTALADQYGGQVRMVWQSAIHGFAVHLDARQAAKLAADPRVAYVEQDSEVHVTTTQLSPPSWGLDRIDQRALPMDNVYTFPFQSSNVHAYIIDTGIRVTHAEFGGRAVWGTNTTGDGIDNDCNGHGTHVAGTVGGTQYGVAKGVQLVAVKVLGCGGGGTTAGVIDGINWVTQHVIRPAVANLSLGGAANDALDTAVRGSIATGITYAIASGNDNVDACTQSPARVTEALTVNASDISDRSASFTNHGSCTDLFAPGVNITSSWNTSDTATNTLQGTSQATPHVTGIAAIYLSNHPNATQADLNAVILSAATPNRVINANPTSPNRLLFSRLTIIVNNPGTRTIHPDQPFALQMTATGGSPAYTWSAISLPPFSSINPSTGLISGENRASPGSLVSEVTATDTAGNADTVRFTWIISDGGCPRC